MSDLEDEDTSPHGLVSDQRLLMDIAVSMRAIGSAVETMHQDLRQLIEENHVREDKILESVKDMVSKQGQLLQVLPITTSDRLERLIEKKVDGVMDDVRISVNAIGHKLSYYAREKDAANTIAPAPVHDEPTTSLEFKKDEVRLHVNTENLEKAWKVLKWVAVVVVSAGGGWELVSKIVHAIKNAS